MRMAERGLWFINTLKEKDRRKHIEGKRQECGMCTCVRCGWGGTTGRGGRGWGCMNVIPMSYMLFIGNVARFSVVGSPWVTFYFHGGDFSPV